MKMVFQAIGIGFSTMWAFMAEGLNEILPWVVVMTTTIVCNFIADIRCKIILKTAFDFTKNFVWILSKGITYFSAILAITLVENANDGLYGFDKWFILFLCLIEFLQIISNLLKPLGYDINLISVLSLIGKKTLNINKEDTEEIITSNKNKL